MGSQLLILSFHTALNKVKPKRIVLFVTAARSFFFQCALHTPHIVIVIVMYLGTMGCHILQTSKTFHRYRH